MNPPRASQPQAVLVLPRLRVQNANAISSPLTHGFPSITAFTGLMWALERKLGQAGIALQLLKVGVICHAHDEQVVDGYVKTFRLTRNPVGKDGKTAAIVEEGRIHLDITLVFGVAMPDTAALIQATEDPAQALAQQAAQLLSSMRIAVEIVRLSLSWSSLPLLRCWLRLTEPRLHTAVSVSLVFNVISVHRLDECTTPTCCWGERTLQASLNVIQGWPVSNSMVSILRHRSLAARVREGLISPRWARAS